MCILGAQVRHVVPACADRSTSRRRAMIKVSVMYPNTPGARFDHEYYRDKHMPLVKNRMGDRRKYYTVDKGLGCRAPCAHAI